jgi:ABC-type antimicrobial peptide transport system permease subunit
MVVMALGFSIAAIISVYTGVEASKDHTQNMIDDTIANTDAMIADYEQYINDMTNLSTNQAKQLILMNLSSSGGAGKGGGRNSVIGQEVILNISSWDVVADAIPKINQRFGENPKDPDFELFGVPIDQVLNAAYYLTPPLIEGSNIDPDNLSQVIIGNDLKEFFDTGLGGEIEINGHNLTVVGIHSGTVIEKGVYVNIEKAAAIVGMNPGECRMLEVYLHNASVVSDTKVDIEESYPSFWVTTYEESKLKFDRMETSKLDQIAKLESDKSAQIELLSGDMAKIESTGTQVILISAISAGLIIMFLMLYSVKERTKEIGVLKALGFTGSNVMAQFMIEGTLIGLIGGIVGVGFAWLAAPTLSDIFLPNTEAYVSATPSMEFIVLALGLTALLGAIGTLYPAWSASRKSPVEAIRNE